MLALYSADTMRSDGRGTRLFVFVVAMFGAWTLLAGVAAADPDPQDPTTWEEGDLIVMDAVAYTVDEVFTGWEDKLSVKLLFEPIVVDGVQVRLQAWLHEDAPVA